MSVELARVRRYDPDWQKMADRISELETKNLQLKEQRDLAILLLTEARDALVECEENWPSPPYLVLCHIEKLLGGTPKELT